MKTIEGIKARRVIEALCSGPKLQILKMLIEYGGGLTATDVAKKLGVKLSTALTHLEDLVNAGLLTVSTEGSGRIIKKYYVSDSEVMIKINLKELLGIETCEVPKELTEEEEELRALAMEYVRIKRSRRRSKLPLRPKVRDVATVLNLSIDKAIEIVNYINTHQDEIVNELCPEVQEILRRAGSMKVKDIADELKVHPYWVVLCIERLVRIGVVKVRDNLVRITESSSS